MYAVDNQTEPCRKNSEAKMGVYGEKEEVIEWAEKHFGDVELGDERRDRRAVQIGAAMAANPGKSLPEIFNSTYDLKAAYNFFRREGVGPEELQSGHRELVLEEMRKRGKYLLIEDTSELSWSGNKPIAGLGPIGGGKAGLQGFHLHSVIGVRWPEKESIEGKREEEIEGKVRRPAVEIIGIADQQYRLRQSRPKGEGKKDSQAKKKRARESQWWWESSERIGEAPQEEGVKWIRVCDRGADIYEMMVSCEQNNHRYVIRASWDRSVTNEEGREQVGKLFETVRKSPAIMGFKLELRGRQGKPGRTAHLKISVTSVWLRAPQRPGKGRGSLPPIKCNVVRVWEENPRIKEPIEWILLTDLEVDSPEKALEVALMYSTRWVIEDFHKALKSGTGAEKLQLETAEGLFAAIAMKSVVALRLIDLREHLRIEPEAPAEKAGLTKLELDILQAALNRKIKTVKEVALGLGRLGGHLNRKADGLPGWQTLWRGMLKLNYLVQGARLALKVKRFG